MEDDMMKSTAKSSVVAVVVVVVVVSACFSTLRKHRLLSFALSCHFVSIDPPRKAAAELTAMRVARRRVVAGVSLRRRRPPATGMLCES
uniref:Uncharacterized protein n=1 Tax=Oryza nivara TaxID=4536 RepID=A0A0E0HTW9_ORYNI